MQPEAGTVTEANEAAAYAHSDAVAYPDSCTPEGFSLVLEDYTTYPPRTHRGFSDNGPDLVRMYLEDIGRFRVLTRDEEASLGRRISEGQAAAATLEDPEVRSDEALVKELRLAADNGQAARDIFIHCNLKLVVSIAKRYKATGHDILTLASMGYTGLETAVDKFDYRKGFKFSTYATNWIKQAIQRELPNHGRTGRVPTGVADAIFRMNRERELLEGDLGREPTHAELAGALGVSSDRLYDLQAAESIASSAVALDQPVNADGDTSLGDLITRDLESGATTATPDEHMEQAGVKEWLGQLLDRLGDRERQMVVAKFAGGLTLHEIGKAFNISGEMARRIINDSLGKLRKAAGEEAFEAAGLRHAGTIGQKKHRGGHFYDFDEISDLMGAEPGSTRRAS